MTPNRLPIVMFVFIGLVVVALIGVLAASWIWFAVAIAIYVVGSALVLTGWARAARGSEHADPDSERLDREAGRALPDGEPRNVQTELEALKREPAQRL